MHTEKGVSLDCFKTTTKKSKYSTVFYCCMPVTDNSLSNAYPKRRCMWLLSKSEGLAIELAQEANENDMCYEFQNVKNPDIPYLEKIPDMLYLGRTITIFGRINEFCQSFAINLLNDDEDERSVFFHFNPRFDRKIVVRNHRKKDIWGTEEISASNPFPFSLGRGFRITIYIADNQLMVAVNFRHYCSFTPRMSLDQASFLEIIGCVTIQLIQYGMSHFYPDLPSARLPRIVLPCWPTGRVSLKRKIVSMVPGTKIIIHGRVKLLPQGFYVNLQAGATQVPHPLIPLHINLRLCQPGLLEQQMVYNSWMNGCWGEEIHMAECPFAPGRNFTLRILYYSTGFHVSVNEKYLIAFPMRLPNPPVLDTLHVNGDVIISKVKISSFDEQSQRTDKIKVGPEVKSYHSYETASS